jgi:hypothetical protein
MKLSVDVPRYLGVDLGSRARAFAFGAYAMDPSDRGSAHRAIEVSPTARLDRTSSRDGLFRARMSTASQHTQSYLRRRSSTWSSCRCLGALVVVAVRLPLGGQRFCPHGLPQLSRAAEH